MEGRMGRSDSCLSPIPGPGVGDFNHRHEPPRSTIGDFFGACNAQSNNAPHPKRLSISCATEKACHRLDRFSRGDREGEPQRQHSIAAYPSALTSTKRPKTNSKVRATGQQFETLIQPDQMTSRHADRIDANTITQKLDKLEPIEA